MGKGLKIAIVLIIAVVIACMTAWTSLAIYYSNLSSDDLRSTIAIGFVVCTAAAFLFIKKRLWTLIGYLIIFV